MGSGYRRSYGEDPGLERSLFDLLEACFPGIRSRASFMRRFGARWEEASTPFVHLAGTKAVSHVGVLSIPMMLMGRSVRVGGIHAVCTHPEHRRRGHYRRVMEEALDWCDERFETLLLSTDQPALYEPFGFRVVEEVVSSVDPPPTAGTDGLRRLDPDEPGDMALVDRLLREREPVSNVAGVVGERHIFAFHVPATPLYHLADLDLAVALHVRGTTLSLFDVVGRCVCSLAEILRRVPDEVRRVEIHFAPDRLTAGDAVQAKYACNDLLMLRGPFPPEGRPFMLPPTARC